MHNFQTASALLQADLFVSVELAGDGERNEGTREAPEGGGSYFWPAAGISEKEEGGEWA